MLLGIFIEEFRRFTTCYVVLVTLYLEDAHSQSSLESTNLNTDLDLGAYPRSLGPLLFGSVTCRHSLTLRSFQVKLPSP